MKNPLISIIVPVYNAEQYLKECLDSICQQTFTDFELILINDGSTDASGRICDEFAWKDPRIRVFHEHNGGVSVARNIGLDNTKGEWIAFIDADDRLLPKALDHLYNATISIDVDIVLAGSNMLVDGKIIPYYVYKPLQSSEVLKYIDQQALWGYLIRARVIHDNNIRFISGLAYSEDIVFLSEVAIKSRLILHIAECVYIYRCHNSSACAARDGVMRSGHQFHAAYALMKLADNELDNQKRKYLINKKKKLIYDGCNIFVSLSFSYANYLKYEKLYLQFFNGRFSLFLNTMIARATFLRRKIITIKDTPFTGRQGIVSRLKDRFLTIFNLINSNFK